MVVTDWNLHDGTNGTGRTEECRSSCPHQHYKAPNPSKTSGNPAIPCLRCDPQCNGCRSAGPRQCIDCRHFENDGVCAPTCPRLMYGNVTAHRCMSCSRLCMYGCSTFPDHCLPEMTSLGGSGNTALSACTPEAVLSDNRCVDKCDPDTQFLMGRHCARCHTECRGCTSSAHAHCVACQHVRHLGLCMAQCPAGWFEDPLTRICHVCHDACGAGGCRGKAMADCIDCVRHFCTAVLDLFQPRLYGLSGSFSYCVCSSMILNTAQYCECCSH